MKYLGIDYGDKRVGLAWSDSEGKIAFPRKTLANVGNRVCAEIKKIAKKENISEIVLGLPVTFGGQDSEQTKKVRQFAKKLQGALTLKIEFENEILSSRIARRSAGAKKNVDESAAAIILQSYLDKKNR